MTFSERVWNPIRKIIRNVNPIMFSLLSLFIVVWAIGFFMMGALSGLLLAIFIIIIAVFIFIHRWI
jgi:uncharacterized protein YggT (Ycf19 family)